MTLSPVELKVVLIGLTTVNDKANRTSEVSVFNVSLCPQLWFDIRIQQVGCVISLGVGHWHLTLDTWVG